MAVLVPTKTIPQLTAYGLPLAGPEELEIWAVGTSRRITTRDFVLPIDSILTVTPFPVVGSDARQLTLGIGLTAVDGGPGGTFELNATGAVAGPANPTALVGLVAVNGAAVTYMRSDAAPALDQGIAPTWTGNHIFSANQNQVVNAVPQWIFVENDAAADNQAWPIRVSGEQFTIGAMNDIGSVFTPWVAVDRTGTVIDSIALASTALTWNGNPLLSTATAFANPTGTVGLAAVNGVAITAMRSDAAPPLSQAIAPTWTAQHIFSLSGATNAAIFASSAQPQVDWNEADGAANNRRWRFEAQGEQFLGRTVNDANSAAVTWLAVDRTLNVVDTIALTSTALTWNGNPISTAVGANPTASIGLAVQNGVATTFMRSDAAPALSQSITPTWTGMHTFSQAVSGTTYPIFISSVTPGVALNETDGAADNRLWDFAANGEQLLFRVRNDAASTTVSWLTVDRTGTVVDTITFPNGTVAVTNASSFGGEATFTNSNTVGGSYAIELMSSEPAMLFRETGVTADNGQWDMGASGESLRFRAINDAYAVANNWMTVNRTGATIDSVQFPTTTATSFLVGTGSAPSGYAAPLSHFLSAAANVLGSTSQVAGNNCFVAHNTATAGDNFFVSFGTEASYTARGSINYNRAGGLVSYNTTSDARRKKNIKNSTRDSGSIIDAILVREFDWIDSNNHVDHWFVAQELHGVFPLAVTRGGDESDWAIDPSKLVPLLVHEIKSLRGRVAALEQ